MEFAVHWTTTLLSWIWITDTWATIYWFFGIIFSGGGSWRRLTACLFAHFAVVSLKYLINRHLLGRCAVCRYSSNQFHFLMYRIFCSFSSVVFGRKSNIVFVAVWDDVFSLCELLGAGLCTVLYRLQIFGFVGVQLHLEMCSSGYCVLPYSTGQAAYTSHLLPDKRLRRLRTCSCRFFSALICLIFRSSEMLLCMTSFRA